MHNKLVNRLISQNSFFVTEEMNYKALQKRSKKKEKQEKLSTIVKKDGSSITIHKNKKTKRFGGSIKNRAPAYLMSQLEKRCNQYDCVLLKVDTKKYKASKTNHITKETENIKLSDRSKLIGGKLVQRDLYSAFLLKCYKNNEEIDGLLCFKEFERFKELHELEIIRLSGQKNISCIGY